MYRHSAIQHVSRRGRIGVKCQNSASGPGASGQHCSEPELQAGYRGRLGTTLSPNTVEVRRMAYRISIRRVASLSILSALVAVVTIAFTKEMLDEPKVWSSAEMQWM